jgi:hypothetical protein
MQSGQYDPAMNGDDRTGRRAGRALGADCGDQTAPESDPPEALATRQPCIVDRPRSHRDGTYFGLKGLPQQHGNSPWRATSSSAPHVVHT